MQTDLDVNPVFKTWQESTGEQKDAALFELVKKLETFARTICWQRLPDYRSEFGPLINDIVWRVIGKSNSFNGKSQFSTWVYRIIVNECNRLLRKRKELYETSLEETLQTETPDVDARIDVVGFLDILDGDDHTLFRMVIEGEDFNTIGKKLKITRNTALQRWNRLRGKLRNA